MNSETFNAVKYAKEIEDQSHTLVPDTLSADQIRDATTAMLEVYESEREVSEKSKRRPSMPCVFTTSSQSIGTSRNFISMTK